jgi:hypothetical protein
MAAFVQKPIDFELFRDCVKRALARVPAPDPPDGGN